MMSNQFMTRYGPEAERTSMPLGGLGAGMICFARNGALESVSINHRPAMQNDPSVFASLHCVSNGKTRILQGQIPYYRVMMARGPGFSGSGNGAGNHYGLPCYPTTTSMAGFPFAEVELQDDRMPVQCTVTAWSPFIPGDDHHSGLPCGFLEYNLRNTSSESQELVFGFHSENFMALDNNTHRGHARVIDHGFSLEGTRKPDDKAQNTCDAGCDCQGDRVEAECPVSLAASLIGVEECVIDCGWFRSGWFDKRTALWDTIRAGKLEAWDSHKEGNDCGASVGARLTLKADEQRRITVVLSWYAPRFKVSDHAKEVITTWYATRYDSISALNTYLQHQYESLRGRSHNFAKCIHENDMPAALRSAVTRNLAILKSPSFLRTEDGSLWGWEGCHDNEGCCSGSCTHVYNYAQALAFLFPQLERKMRDVEFGPSQDERGHQQFRANIPFTKPFETRFHAAADGQLGGIVRIYRDWVFSGETEWLRAKWPAVRQSLEYCINEWDLQRNGRLAEPHHNTFDVEFWGEDGLCSTMYAAALQAAIAMATKLGESTGDWDAILSGVRAVIKEELFDGWIRQNVHWRDLRADDPTAVSIGTKQISPECAAIIEREGPRYQYGNGVLIDAALGCQVARIAGLGAVVDEDVERGHIDAVMKYNYKSDLREHACFQRPAYALAEEAGTIMCSWPEGGRLSMPFPYSDEVFTGSEHQFAAHLVMLGRLEDALKVEEAVNRRYDGRIRNPFNEIECGHFYIRALASYGLVPAFSGAHYNAVDRTMTLNPAVAGDFTSFFAIGSAWGRIGARKGEPFLDLEEGELPIERWQYTQRSAPA